MMNDPQRERRDDGSRLESDHTATSRRAFMLMSLGLLAAGCTSTTTTKTVSSLPGPDWPDHVPDHRTERKPAAPSPPTDSLSMLPGGVIPRSRWAKGQPVVALMNRMIPVRYITVHHDGMNPFYGDSAAAAAARLELIRRGHRNRNWGDIGYHFIVDRGGRVWQGRPLVYQGAHVKDHNEGNIGVMCLGNFEQQAPTVQQLDGLNRYLTLLMGQFRVPIRYVKTHQEWAPTACPGRNLQRHMVAVRSSRAIG